MVVNTKGQIVIPKEIREKFGIYPGQMVQFKEDKGKIVLIKTGIKEKFKSLSRKYQFQFPKGIETTKEFVDKIRGQ